MAGYFDDVFGIGSDEFDYGNTDNIFQTDQGATGILPTEQTYGVFDDVFFTQPSRSWGEAAKDSVLSLGQGLIGAQESLVGIANLAPTWEDGGIKFGAAGRAIEGLYDSEKEKAYLESLKSPARQFAAREFQNADGFMGKFQAALEYPSNIVDPVIQSFPSMATGAGLYGRAAQMSSKVPQILAPSLGEGIVSGGAAMENIRQKSETGTITPGQAAMGLASGAGTTAFGVIGNRIANRFGVNDADALLAGIRGSARTQGATDISARAIDVGERMIKAGFSEGVIEELPQSIQEQVWMNFATNKPWNDGLDETAVSAITSGFAMGAGANIGGVSRQSAEQQPPTQSQPVVPVQQAPSYQQQGPGVQDAPVSIVPDALQQMQVQPFEQRVETASTQVAQASTPDGYTSEAPSPAPSQAPSEVLPKKPDMQVVSAQLEQIRAADFATIEQIGNSIPEFLRNNPEYEPYFQTFRQEYDNRVNALKEERDGAVQDVATVPVEPERGGEPSVPLQAAGAVAGQSQAEGAGVPAGGTAKAESAKRLKAWESGLANPNAVRALAKSNGISEEAQRQWLIERIAKAKAELGLPVEGGQTVSEERGQVSDVPAQVAAPEVAPAVAPVATDQGQQQVAVQPNIPPGAGARKVSAEGRKRIIAAQKNLKEVINNPDITGKDRADRIANGKNLVGFLTAKGDSDLETAYSNGNKIAFTGEDAPEGMRHFIYLDGPKAGSNGVIADNTTKDENARRQQAAWKDQQEQFSRLNAATSEAATPSPPAQASPPAAPVEKKPAPPKAVGKGEKKFWSKDGKVIGSRSVEAIGAYYSPGREYQSYGGKDRVESFQDEGDGRFTVTVRSVNPDGSLGEQRTHRTPPDDKQLASFLASDGWTSHRNVSEAKKATSKQPPPVRATIPTQKAENKPEPAASDSKSAESETQTGLSRTGEAQGAEQNDTKNDTKDRLSGETVTAPDAASDVQETEPPKQDEQPAKQAPPKQSAKNAQSYTKEQLASVQVTVKGLLPNGKVGEYQVSADKALADIDDEITLYEQLKGCIG